MNTTPTEEAFESAIGAELDEVRERLSDYTDEQLTQLENYARSENGSCPRTAA